MLDPHWHYDVAEFFVFRRCYENAAVGIAKRKYGRFTGDVVQSIHKVIYIESDIDGLAVVIRFDIFLRLFMFTIAADDTQVLFG